jgi:hypothetical protein
MKRRNENTKEIFSFSSSQPVLSDATGKPRLLKALSPVMVVEFLRIGDRAGEYKTWSTWDHDPLEIRGTNNNVLFATLSGFNLSLYRVTENNGAKVCFETFLFYVTSHGWSNQTDKMFIQLFNASGRLINVCVSMVQTSPRVGQCLI